MKDLTFGHEKSKMEVNRRSNGGQLEVKDKISCKANMGVFKLFFFVSGNPYLALDYCSDVTGGRNCHLKVKIGGQLEVKHKNILYWTYGCHFIGFLYLGIQIWQ